MFGLSTDFVIAIYEDDQYILYDIYNPCKMRGGTLKTRRMGYWNESNGLNIILEIDKMSRWNLEGMTLKMSGLVSILQKFSLAVCKLRLVNKNMLHFLVKE